MLDGGATCDLREVHGASAAVALGDGETQLFESPLDSPSKLARVLFIAGG
jgi:hypothetical protein